MSRDAHSPDSTGRTHADDARRDMATRVPTAHCPAFLQGPRVEPTLSDIFAAATSSKHEVLVRIDEVDVVQSAKGATIERLDARTAVLETATTAFKHETDGLANRIADLEARPAAPPTQSPAPSTALSSVASSDIAG